MTAVDGLLPTADEVEWLDVRERLIKRRNALRLAAADEYEDAQRLAGTPLLTQRRWMPARPLPLDAVSLRFQDSLLPVEPLAGVPDDGLPTRLDGTRYPSYSAAMAELAPPPVFENRPAYRLLDADLSRQRGELVFGMGWCFDAIDTGEAAAHEYAAASSRRLRDAVGDPCDLERRPATLALAVLTLRVEEGGAATFLLRSHGGGQRRDVADVTEVFRPVTDEHADLSLWRRLAREHAEALPRGTRSEDVERWATARRAGDLTASVVGLGVDPLTFATHLLVVCEVRAAAFDELFGRGGPRPGFDAETVRRHAGDESTPVAGAALLRLAHRMAGR